MPQIVLLLVLAAGLSWALMLGAIHWAERLGVLDFPDGSRHGPTQPVPRAGGIAVLGATLLTWGVATVLMTTVIPVSGNSLARVHTLALGALLICLLGVWDDVWDVRPAAKLAVQVSVALLLLVQGIGIERLEFLGEGQLLLPGWAAAAATVLWVTAITNAFNLIDGADGVAGGTAILGLLTMAGLATVQGNLPLAVFCLILAAATGVFLAFNFPPARIFLGDAGSMLLGFVLAGAGILVTQAESRPVPLVVPVLVFGLPVLDTSLAIIRRFLSGQHVFSRDRGHVHHRLREIGHPPWRVATVLYGVTVFFILVGFLIPRLPTPMAVTAAVTLVLASLAATRYLRIPAFVEAQSSVHRVAQQLANQRRVIAQNARVRGAIDQVRIAEERLAVVAAMTYAFAASEFGRVEVWLPDSLTQGMRRRAGRDRDGDGGLHCAWAWEAEKTGQEGLWEIRLPFRGPRQRVLGWLSLWRRERNDPTLTDLRLMAVELLPAIVDALVRMSAAEVPGKAMPVGATREVEEIRRATGAWSSGRSDDSD